MESMTFAVGDCWTRHQKNRPPDKPGGPPSNPAKFPSDLDPQGWCSGWRPVFLATFADPDEEFGDHLTKYEIHLFRKMPHLDNVYQFCWRTEREADLTERLHGRVCCPYDGEPLGEGAYRWRVRVADAFGCWSEWSDPVVFSLHFDF